MRDPASVCGAKRQRGGEPCQAYAMANGRCKVHGGMQPVGLASPNTTTGRYSKDIPTRLSARYEQALADPDLISARHDIALIDARISDLLTRVDTGESGAQWKAVRKAYTAYSVAQFTGDALGTAMALKTLEQSIADGITDYEAWHEIHVTLDQRRKLIDSERERLKALNQFLTVEQAMLYVSAVVGTVKKHVSDRHTLAAISRDLAALSNRAERPVIPAGG